MPRASRSSLLIAILAIAALLCVLDRKTRAQQPPRSRSADRAELARIEQRWLAHESDPAVLADILAGDFVHALPQGFITRNEQLDYLRRRQRAPRAATPPQKRFSQLRIRLYGHIGIVNGIVESTPASGPATRTIFTDVFVRRGGRWQAINAQEDPYLGAQPN